MHFYKDSLDLRSISIHRKHSPIRFSCDLRPRVFASKSIPNYCVMNSELTIAPEQLRHWYNFPTFDEIISFSKRWTGIEAVFNPIQNTLSSTNESRFPISPMGFDLSQGGEYDDEFIRNLNRLIRVAHCSSTSSVSDNLYVVIDSPNFAMHWQHSHEAWADLVAFWTDGIHPQAGPSDRNPTSSAAARVPCLLVGELRRSRDFKYSHLAGHLRGATERKVATQL